MRRKGAERRKRLPISRAREMLEFSCTGIDEIASRVGYIDIDAFRRVFRKITGLTPSDYRRRFSRLSRSKSSVANGSTRYLTAQGTDLLTELLRGAK